MRHPTDIGDISKMMITAHLVRAGYRVLLAASENCRYDVGLDQDGKLSRVQCKTGRLQAGAVRFPTCSLTGTGSIRVRKNYKGQIEFFGVYCPETEKCYLVPVDDVPKREGALRVEPPRNKQRALIRMASKYEIKTCR